MRTPNRRSLPLAPLVLGILLAACGGGGGGSPAEPPRTAVVALSLAPDPVSSVPCTGCGNLPGELELVATASLRETAGVGARIVRFVASLRNGAGALVVAGDDRPGVRDRVPGNGTATIPLPLHFPGGPGNANVPATLILEVTLIDDNGHTLSLMREARVLPP